VNGLLATTAAACLVLGFAGGSTAANLVTGADIENGTVSTKDVQDRSLRSADFTAATHGPRGPAGPPGSPGAPGADAEAGYSWAFRATSPQLPAASTGVEYVVACPAGSTVLGGGYFNDRAIDLLDSSKVPGQEKWRLYLGNASGNTTEHPFVYAWCAGLSAPTVVVG
jgi:hypothetical protein